MKKLNYITAFIIVGVILFQPTKQTVTNYIAEVIEHPGAFQVVNFAEGKIKMVGVKTKKQGFFRKVIPFI